MKNTLSWLNHPSSAGPQSILILRIMAGGVSLCEGILKFVYANQDIGRFMKLGMPFPLFTADFVAGDFGVAFAPGPAACGHVALRWEQARRPSPILLNAPHWASLVWDPATSRLLPAMWPGRF
jgi:hypothetical protein